MSIILASQEAHVLKPAGGNSLLDPILKKPMTKRAGGVAQGVGPEFKPQYHENYLFIK
jgi:hypothetical protein